jgi:hypothetical protein
MKEQSTCNQDPGEFYDASAQGYCCLISAQKKRQNQLFPMHSIRERPELVDKLLGLAE